MALIFFSGELTATPLVASCSREQAKPAAVGCSGPRWMKHICHSMRSRVAREVIKALLFITTAFIVSFCLRSMSTALPYPSCLKEKVRSGTVENH